jgi:carboxylesterase type B
MNLGQPIIVVTINYRLNVFGFSSCGELVQEAIQQRKVPVRNQGLRDQRLALQWIQANIHNFGGDAARVTVGGESAGAASVFYHLKSTEPLFHQAFIQSSPLPQLRSFEEAQQDFDGLVEAAGIDRGLPGQEKLAQLRKLSWAELVDVFSGKVSTPIFDPNWFAGRPLSSTDTRFWADIPAWCERVILGHTRDEASLFLAPLLSMPMTEICTVLHTALEGTGIDLDEYKSPTELVRALSLPVTLNTFVRPCLALGTTAASQGKTIYIHEFAVVDPFSGPLNGFAWHSIGNAILFYQPACRRDSAISKVADQLSESLMSFLHGGQPWQAFGVESKKIVLDGAGAPMEEVHPALTTQSLPSPNMGVGFVMSLLKTLA